MSLADLIAGKPAPASIAEVAAIAVAKPADQHPVDSGSVAKIAGTTPTPENMEDELLSRSEPAGGATAIDAIPATESHEAFRAALAEAGDGLPVTLAELLREFGAEGREGWEAGDYAHPAFLRAFAKTVAERLKSDQEAELKPPPDPLSELPLLREDRQFVHARIYHRRDREQLLTEYARRWTEAAEAEPVEVRKANAGRMAANTWLREKTQRKDL